VYVVTRGIIRSIQGVAHPIRVVHHVAELPRDAAADAPTTQTTTRMGEGIPTFAA
jgi:hypothetical protein